MKTASSFAKSLVLIGFALPTLAQTAPGQTGKTAAPQPASKTAVPKALAKKYEGPKVAESTQKLGQKFVDKSHEVKAPTNTKLRPIPIKVAPDQK
jgi:hypothetical protein